MNTSKRILCGLKWLNSLAALLTIWWMLWCRPSDIGLWLHYNLLPTSLSQAEVRQSLSSYSIIVHKNALESVTPAGATWTPESSRQAAAQTKLLVSTDGAKDNFTYLILTFEGDTLIKKDFTWD